MPQLHPHTSTLSGLCDRRVLPVPASTPDAIFEQIDYLWSMLIDCFWQSNNARHLGLPTDRLDAEIIWGAQCFQLLLDAWSAARSVSATQFRSA